MSTFEFNGISKDYLKIARGWVMPTFAPIEHEYVSVPSRPGGIITKSSTGVRRFSIPVILLANDFETREQFEEEMAAWLITDEPKPLVFSKYPFRTLYARIEGTLELEQFHPMAQGEITFVCEDPYKYGPEESVTFSSGLGTVNYPGTVDGLPEIEITVGDDVTYVDVISDGSYFRIGQPEMIDEAPYEPSTLVANYPLNTTIGWADATTVDNGYVSGTMAASSQGFSPSTYGATIEPKKYQGPAKRRSLPEPLQDFELEVTLELLNGAAEIGMIEIYLIDALGNTVMKGGIEDRWASTAQVRGKFQVGNVGSRAVDYSRTPAPETAWNNFKGVFRMSRRGQTLRPYFALVDAQGKHTVVSSTFGWIDVNENYQAEIVEVMISMRTWPDSTPATMRARNMKFTKFNAHSEGVPIIADVGDVIVIDTKTSNITINGEDRKDLKDFGALFPRLKEGENTIVLEPAGSLSGTIKYRGRYL